MPKLSDHEIKVNLRALDLDLIYKFIPENIKSQIIPKQAKLSDLRDRSEVIGSVLEEKRSKRSTLLRAKIKPNQWALVRWGQGTKLGKIYLAAVKELPKGSSLQIWTQRGNFYIPIWWIEKLYAAEELEPVPSWKSPRLPILPENHPVKTDPTLMDWMEDGFFEKLFLNTKSAIAAAHSAFLSWSADARDLRSKLKNLSEDQLSALYLKVQNMRMDLEKERLERFNLERLPKGSWLSVKPDRVAQISDVVFMDYLKEEDSLIIWNPEDDEIEKIPAPWLQRLNVQKKRVRVDRDEVSDEDRLEHSEPYRALQVKESSAQIRQELLRKCLWEQLSATQPWTVLWASHNKNFHKLVRERGQALLNWFGRWRDPELPNQESFSHLAYDTARPLVVLIVLTFIADDETIGEFIRAEVDLFEGTVKAKDADLSKILRDLIA